MPTWSPTVISSKAIGKAHWIIEKQELNVLALICPSCVQLENTIAYALFFPSRSLACF